MTVTHMEIRDCFGENLPGLSLERTRDALAAFAQVRWPAGRRKAVMKEWGLNEDEARSVISGRCSWATWDKIIAHPRGGWSVLFPVYAALLNETAADAINRERARHAEHAKRLGALVFDWPARAAARADAASDLPVEPDRRRGARHG